jgi:hypothetical protein
MVFSLKGIRAGLPETGSSTSQRSRQGSTDGRQDASVHGTRRP